MNRRDFLKYAALGTASVAPLSAGMTFPNSELIPIQTPDLFLPQEQKEVLYSTVDRIMRVKKTIGYGHFNIVSFDDMIAYSKRYSRIGRFTKEELTFMEQIFYANPSDHGFFGKQITQNMTDRIKKKEVKKIPYTGHYLFKDTSVGSYNHMCKDIGNTLVLTSGVRSVVKQFSLYLDKIKRSDLNLNVASRSLAPPAYTYHSIGDFDVGKKGFGHYNFTSRFALTKEFSQMRKLKYIDVRYTMNNIDGVRYEPWHVKII
ncbi:MAG: M15 family metallopeptidase [Campylobacterota bacterium]|nr:M15 family metallopeptidase [Campylobacterota bacterium]